MLPIYKLNFNRVHIQFNYTLSATNSMVKRKLHCQTKLDRVIMINEQYRGLRVNSLLILPERYYGLLPKNKQTIELCSMCLHFRIGLHSV